MIPTQRLFCILAWCVLLVLGCNSSKKTSTVHGKVTYKGQPVGGGTITFHRLGENQSGAYSFPLQTDGTYSGSSLPLEEMVVTVETESANPKRTLPTYRQPGGPGKSPTDEYDKKMREAGHAVSTPAQGGQYVAIPPHYADKKTSDLKANLASGKDTWDFDLKDKN